MNDEVVTRLYRCLAGELRRRGHDEESPVKVAELYQDLVPYRSVRSALGVELNADYEHALLRLLAGEGGLLRIEPEAAREELRREVEAPYPFVGIFRRFAASDVWVSVVDEPEVGSEPEETARPAESSRPSEATGDSAIPVLPVARPRIAAEADEPLDVRPGGGPAPARAPAPVQLHREEAGRDPAERITHAGAECVFCAEDLPSGRRVRFCPHCGGDQRLRPCPRCDAVLEREWRYCISCGHEIGGR